MKKLNKEQAKAVHELCSQYAYANINQMIDCAEQYRDDPLYKMPDKAPYSVETVWDLQNSLGIAPEATKKWWEVWK